MKSELPTHRAAAMHARCWNSLPWLVNGTLPVDEIARVELHVAECAECAAELRAQSNLQTQLRDGDAVLMAPQSAWQKMAERLDNEDEALARRYSGPGAKAPPHRGVQAGLWPWAVAAQALIVVGLTAVMWLQQPRYETLTAAPTATTAPGGLRVVFRRDVTLTEVNALLRELQAQIVAGPSEAGVYTLALSSRSESASTATANTSSQQATAVLLKRLRADARIVFAEPIFAEPIEYR